MQEEVEKRFKVNFGKPGTSTNHNCYLCGIDNFQLSRFYTEKDIRDIGELGVGQTWRDPDYDLSQPKNKKVKSYLRVRRLQ